MVNQTVTLSLFSGDKSIESNSQFPLYPDNDNSTSGPSLSGGAIP